MVEIWQIIVHSNTLNFLIVLMVVLFIMSKLNIGQKLENIKNEIKAYVDDSSNEKIDAEKELEKITAKVEQLPNDIQYIEQSALNSVRSLEETADAKVKEQMVDIDNSAKRIMNLETKKFKSKLTSVLSEASVVLAKENALKQLENNRELHNKYIYDAIDEIDRVDL